MPMIKRKKMLITNLLVLYQREKKVRKVKKMKRMKMINAEEKEEIEDGSGRELDIKLTKSIIISCKVGRDHTIHHSNDRTFDYKCAHQPEWRVKVEIRFLNLILALNC